MSEAGAASKDGEDLVDFLAKHSFSQYAPLFREQGISTVAQLAVLESSDLKDLGIPGLAAAALIRLAKKSEKLRTNGGQCELFFGGLLLARSQQLL